MKNLSEDIINELVIRFNYSEVEAKKILDDITESEPYSIDNDDLSVGWQLHNLKDDSIELNIKFRSNIDNGYEIIDYEICEY